MKKIIGKTKTNKITAVFFICLVITAITGLIVNFYILGDTYAYFMDSFLDDTNKERTVNVNLYYASYSPKYGYEYKKTDTKKYKYTSSDGNFGITFDLDSLEIPTLDGYIFTGWGVGVGGPGWQEAVRDASDKSLYSCTTGQTGKVKLYGEPESQNASVNIYPCYRKGVNITDNLVTVGYLDRGPTNGKWAPENLLPLYTTCKYDPSKESGCTIKNMEVDTRFISSSEIFTGWGDHRRCYYGEMEPKVSYDTNFYPCFRPKYDSNNYYFITYNANGGTGAPMKQGYRKGLDEQIDSLYQRKVTISTIIPQRSGYKFLGWNTDKSAKNATWYPGDIITYWNPPEIFSKQENTLYAIWQKNSSSSSSNAGSSGGSSSSSNSSSTSPTPVTYTVSYNANGGNDAPAKQTKKHGVNLILRDDIPTREGYLFLGWDTDKNASSAKYQAGGIYSSNSSVTLYAIWNKLVTYTVSYNANGGNGAPSKQTKTQGVNLTLRDDIPTREGKAIHS